MEVEIEDLRFKSIQNDASKSKHMCKLIEKKTTTHGMVLRLACTELSDEWR